MKKILFVATLIFAIVSCGNNVPEGKIDTVENAAQTYCNAALNLENAAAADRDELKNALNELENKIEKEHDGDETWFNDFEERVEEICQKG